MVRLSSLLGKGQKNHRFRLTALSLIWSLWDIKKPKPLFEKSTGHRPWRCGQTFPGLGRLSVRGVLNKEITSSVVLASCKQCMCMLIPQYMAA